MQITIEEIKRNLSIINDIYSNSDNTEDNTIEIDFNNETVEPEEIKKIFSKIYDFHKKSKKELIIKNNSEKNYQEILDIFLLKKLEDLKK